MDWLYAKTRAVHYGTTAKNPQEWDAAFKRIVDIERTPGSPSLDAKGMLTVSNSTTTEGRQIVATRKDVQTTVAHIAIAPTLSYDVAVKGHFTLDELSKLIKSRAWLSQNTVMVARAAGFSGYPERIGDKPNELQTAFKYITGEEAIAMSNPTITKITYGTTKV